MRLPSENPPPGTHNVRIWHADRTGSVAHELAHIEGGSARGYQEFVIPLEPEWRTSRQAGRAGYLCIANAGLERPLLHDMRVIFVRILAG